MQAMIVDMIDDCYNLKVLIVNNFNLEYVGLCEKVIIYNDTLFEPRKIIGTITMGNFKWYSNIFSQHGGSQLSVWWSDRYMQNIPIQVDDIPYNMSYNYKSKLLYVCFGNVHVDKIQKLCTNLC